MVLLIGATSSTQAQEVVAPGEKMLSLPADLTALITAAVQQHPAVGAAKATARAFGQEIAVAERAKWPALSVATEQTIGGPTAASQAMALRVEYTLWDNGAAKSRIQAATRAEAVANLQTALQQEDLAMQTINAWQAFGAAKRRVAATQKAEAVIEAFKAQMTRRVVARASPAIELDLVEARLLQTQVERMSAATAVNAAVRNLTRITGLLDLQERLAMADPDADAHVEQKRLSEFALDLEQIDKLALAQNHKLLKKVQLEGEQLAFQIKAREADLLPQAYARIEQPLANNTFTGSNQASYLVGLRYSPGAGFSSLLEVKALASRLEAQAFQTETALKEINNLIGDDQQLFEISIAHSKAQAAALEGSRLVLASYERQFQGGRKTWQDLLNVAREVAQNEVSLIDTIAAAKGAMHRLQVRLGAIEHLIQK